VQRVTEIHPLVRDYLDAVDRRAAYLPPEQRSQLVRSAAAQVHVGPDASESEALTALLRAPAPAELVPRAPQDWLTVGLLLLGGLLLLAGWFWGAWRLWRSRCWTLRDKLIGTLLWPYGLFGGLAPSLWFSATGSGVLDVLLFGVPLIVPFVTAGYLLRRHGAQRSLVPAPLNA
jgi:hypothetical protein